MTAIARIGLLWCKLDCTAQDQSHIIVRFTAVYTATLCIAVYTATLCIAVYTATLCIAVYTATLCIAVYTATLCIVVQSMQCNVKLSLVLSSPLNK